MLTRITLVASAALTTLAPAAIVRLLPCSGMEFLVLFMRLPFLWPISGRAIRRTRRKPARNARVKYVWGEVLRLTTYAASLTGVAWDNPYLRR